MVKNGVCGCSELEGCGWCSHAKQCLPYPECSTTCEECDSTCHNHKHCQASCFHRFHVPRRDPAKDEDSLFPLGSSDIYCAIAIFTATVLASAAGIGGGAVLVPLYTLLGEFTEHEAIPLSIATVFGASAFSTLGNFLWLKHPVVPHRHLIAYDAALVLLPATLLGTTVGVFLNKVTPNWLIVALLVWLCAFSGKRTLSQAFKRREKEDEVKGAYKSIAQGEGEDEGEGGEAHGGAELTPLNKDTSPPSGAGLALTAGAQIMLGIEHAAEAKFPTASVCRLLGTWLAVMGLSMLKGGHGAPSLVGVTCGSLGYWGVVGLNLPVLGMLTFVAGRLLLSRHQRLLSCGYQYAEGDVQWDSQKVWTYPAYVAVGAIAAGMLGVGGGMVLGPIFNELEFLPQVSSATSTLMVLFMSSATVGQFIVFGMLDTQYALFYGSVGIIGAIVGTKGAKSILDRTGRASFLLFFLAAILLGSGVLMASTGLPQIVKTGLTGFRPVCGRSGAAERKFD